MDSFVASKGYVVVGGTAGIGLAAARALAAQGGNVALIGRDRGRADAAAELLSSKHGVRAVAVPGDATLGQAEVDRFIGEAVAALGSVAGLAVTTGTAREMYRHPLAEMSDAAWRRSFEDLFMGTVRPCMAIVPICSSAVRERS